MVSLPLPDIRDFFSRPAHIRFGKPGELLNIFRDKLEPTDEDWSKLASAWSGCEVTISCQPAGSTYLVTSPVIKLETAGTPLYPDSPNPIRYLYRGFDNQWHIYNALIIVARNYRNNKIASIALARQVDLAASADFKSIQLKASGDGHDPRSYDGYKVWPKFGFDAPLPQMFIDRLSTAGQSSILSTLKSQTIASLLKTDRGKHLWDTHGCECAMELDLRSGSVLSRFKSYCEEIGL